VRRKRGVVVGQSSVAIVLGIIAVVVAFLVPGGGTMGALPLIVGIVLIVVGLIGVLFLGRSSRPSRTGF
jgi:hypothetical protein